MTRTPARANPPLGVEPPARSLQPVAGIRCEIERGPNWLFVRIAPGSALPTTPADAEHWCEALWSVCKRHFVYRLVLEMEAVDAVSAPADAALAWLGEQLRTRGGSLKLCGMTDACLRRWDDSHSNLRAHGTRRDAVLSTDSHESVLLKAP
ncbi:MAG: hypothetical protein AAGB00_10540 [Planctomycetota bacterium]